MAGFSMFMHTKKKELVPNAHITHVTFVTQQVDLKRCLT